MTADEVRAHIDPMRPEFPQERSLVLPALKFAQTEKGYLTQADLAAVAEAVSLTPAYVESVASFYDRLYLRPTGTRVVSVCITLTCMLRGSDELLEHICEREGLPHGGGTSEDGAITVQGIRFDATRYEPIELRHAAPVKLDGSPFTLAFVRQNGLVRVTLNDKLLQELWIEPSGGDLALLVDRENLFRVTEKPDVEAELRVYDWRATGEFVRITMPSAAGIAQDAIGLGDFSISTRHMRQLPATESRS